MSETKVKEQEQPQVDAEQIEKEQPVIDAPEQKKTDPDKQAAVQSYMKDKVLGQFTKQEIDVLQSTIAKGTNREEFRLFLATCVSAGLNPFLNHVYPIVFEGKRGRTLNIQISVEGILHLARRVSGYKGIDVQLIHENDDFLASRVEGYMQITKHEIGFPRGQVIGGYCIARREGFPDVVVLMESKEVEKMKSGRNSSMWTEWFNDMFRKHIVKRAAKEQYGVEVSEEDITTGGKGEGPKEEDGKGFIETGEGQKQSEEQVKKELWGKIRTTADEKRMMTDEIQGIIFEKFPGKKHDELNPQQLSALLKFVEFYRKEEKSEPEEEYEIQEGEFIEFDETDTDNSEPEGPDDSIFD